MDKKLLWVWILALASCCTYAEQARGLFNYESVWRIVYFKASEQFVNQRPEQDNNPNQGFYYIYNILIKYAHSFAPMSAVESEMLASALAESEKLYLINEDGYQVIYVGDHFISDGFGWVALQDDDYQKLVNLLLVRKSRVGDVFNGQVEQTLKGYSDDAKRYLVANRDSTLARSQDRSQDRNQETKMKMGASQIQNDDIQVGSSQSSVNNHEASAHSGFKISIESGVARQFSINKSSPSGLGLETENYSAPKNDHSSTGYFIKMSVAIFVMACLFLGGRLLRQRKK